ncbi:Ig-like domain-containing protein [Hyalangium rubrum]|uniref:Ig-like domain-containing protein n=1 Tax=Hyalangium rubrum TaxID=3103134 RepID=A0ABU5HH56_9BACT|nr:Ig-like domain-containing protein [Hyalangium sp. s54d21]MDY7232167.1 Ig-like domain-containing protein [Hyalangium sp. s54d21]
MRLHNAWKGVLLVATVSLIGCGDDEAPRLAKVTVTCGPAPVSAGRTANCTASAQDQDGKPFTVSRYQWSSSDETIAKVDAEGLASAFKQGAVSIKASATEGDSTQEGTFSLTIGAPQATVHQGIISSNQTWRASDNPHLVKGAVFVMGSANPVLTLEEGTEVRFEDGAQLIIGDDTDGPGVLRAEGSPSAPILLTAASANPQPGYWQGISVTGQSAQGTVLSNVTIEYAGGIPANSGELEDLFKSLAAGLRVTGGSDAPDNLRPVTVEDVIIQKSQNHGVLLMGAGFKSDSSRLTVRDTAGVAVRASANEVGTLPEDSTLSGNTPNAVQVLEGAVETTQTWPNLGVPYQLTTTLDIGLSIGLLVASTSSPTLTLSPGTELQMPAKSYISVGTRDESGNLVHGKLKAQGTAQAPIRFVPASASPTKGFWSGLFFHGPYGSTLEYATVTHAGLPLFDTLGGGNINVFADLGFFVSNSTLSDSAGCGVAVDVSSGIIADFTAPAIGNVFTNNDGEAQCRK